MVEMPRYTWASTTVILLAIHLVTLHLMTPAIGASSAPAVTYTADDPAVLFRQRDPPLAIQVTPERVLHSARDLPRIEIRVAPGQAGALAYQVLDGFGLVLLEHERSVEGSGPVGIALPPGHGYYEIIATLRRAGHQIAEARRSIGALPPPAEPVGEEPFGLWIQGDDHYPELGVRWVREGISWESYQAHGERYLEGRRKRFDWYRRNRIRVIAYPKGHPRPYQTSREVIEDTPEAWRAEEAWWTRMVERLAGHVDAWGVVNEPMRGHWKGSDGLIIRYWALMRKIVDRHDPATPLIGPSLSPNIPSQMEQYRDLLGMGLGTYIDAVELHTYTDGPEAGDWHDNTQRIDEVTRRLAGKALPIWSTEHGSSATYEKELLQAQHLARSWLEAKRIGYPVMIWHMFSHPQGTDRREVEFAIFRNSRKNEAQPQPRPAGVAYGVITRQLAGATFRRRIDYLGPSVNAYLFERGGKAMLAVWTIDGKPRRITLPAGEGSEVSVTGLFGRSEPLADENGLVRVTTDRNPQFIAPLPAFLLDPASAATLDKPIEALPGEAAQSTLTLTNPGPRRARMRIEWLPSRDWTFDLPKTGWSLDPRQQAKVTVTARPREDLPVGDYQAYAKVFLDDVFAATLPSRVTVLPQVTVLAVEPGIAEGRPVLSGTLRRQDRRLATAAIRLAGDVSHETRVEFGAGDDARFTIPVDGLPTHRLTRIALTVSGTGGQPQLQENLRVSLIPAVRMPRAPAIDGDLGDWPAEGVRHGPMTIRWGWNERNLFLAVRVADEAHVQRQAVTEMWKEDSLQIAIAPGKADHLVRAYRPGLQETSMVELDVALTRAGPALYRHLTMNKHLAPAGEVGEGQIRRAVRHKDGHTTYELEIPVVQAGLKPLQPGQALRASLLLNASDGMRRRSIEWFGGILRAKDPTVFGHLILQN